jgi:hypothetical protein
VDCREVMTTDHPTDDEFDASDASLTRFDLVKEGARRDGVQIVHYAPRFPVPGTRAERRIERVLALLFLLTGLAGTAFVVAYIAWPWKYGEGDSTYRSLYPFYTPVLGATLGLALLTLGLGIVVWSKKLLPEEVSVQERHDGQSDSTEQVLTAATILNMGDELGLKRRRFVGLAFLAGAAPLGAVAGALLVGSLIKAPTQDGENVFFTTGWDPKHNDGKPVRLTHEDGTPIRPADISVGGQITVFPGIPHCCAPATSHSSRSRTTRGPSSVRPAAPCPSCRLRWTMRGTSSQRRITRFRLDRPSGSGHETAQDRRPGPPGQLRQGPRRAVPGGHPAAADPEQGLPRPLVVPAG